MPHVIQRPLVYVVVDLDDSEDGEVVARFADQLHAKIYADRMNETDSRKSYKVMHSLHMKVVDQDVDRTEKLYMPNPQVTDGCGDWDSWDLKIISQ